MLCTILSLSKQGTYILQLIDRFLVPRFFPNQHWSGKKRRTKVFNWSEVHFYRSTSYKIHTLVGWKNYDRQKRLFFMYIWYEYVWNLVDTRGQCFSEFTNIKMSTRIHHLLKSRICQALSESLWRTKTQFRENKSTSSEWISPLCSSESSPAAVGQRFFFFFLCRVTKMLIYLKDLD